MKDRSKWRIVEVRIQNLSRWLQPSGFLLLAFFPLMTYGLDSKQDPLVHQVTVYRDTYGVPHIVSTRDSRSLRIGFGVTKTGSES